MGHWGHWGGRWRPYRGPSRLLWFLFGAGMATWWIKGKECREYKVKHCMRNRIPPEAYPPPASAQQAQRQLGPAPDAPSPAAVEPRRWPDEHHWHGRRWEWGWPPQMKDGQPGATPGLPPKPADGWEDEAQQLQRMTQQATETVSPLVCARPTPRLTRRRASSRRSQRPDWTRSSPGSSRSKR